MIEPNSLHLGDCLDLMKDIPDGSVDMVLCDLPYGTTACKWDAIIPFESLWTAYRRVCKPNAAVVLTASQPFTSALVMSNPRWFKYDWTWKKPKGTGHLNAKKQPMRDKEDILVFAQAGPNYYPQFTTGRPYKAKPGKSKANGEDCYGVYADLREDNEGKRYPKQVLEFPIEERNKLHPTQKPLALMEYLIKTYTNESEIVLDNTMGSGTTCLAAKNLNRRYIGIEKDPGYFAIAQQRLGLEPAPISV